MHPGAGNTRTMKRVGNFRADQLLIAAHAKVRSTAQDFAQNSLIATQSHEPRY